MLVFAAYWPSARRRAVFFMVAKGLVNERDRTRDNIRATRRARIMLITRIMIPWEIASFIPLTGEWTSTIPITSPPSFPSLKIGTPTVRVSSDKRLEKFSLKTVCPEKPSWIRASALGGKSA